MLHYDIDSYLFIGDKFICLIYVEDLIFWEKYESDIHYLEIKHRDLGVYLEQKEDVARFVAVNL